MAHKRCRESWHANNVMLNITSIDLLKEDRAVMCVSLTVPYTAPRYSRYDVLRADNRNSKAETIIDASLNAGLPPFWNDKSVLGGMDLFYLITDHDKYYPTQADRRIINANPLYFSELPKEKTLVELCCGDMRKTIEWLSNLPKTSWPKQIILNDIVEDNIATSRRKLRRMGYTGPITAINGDVTEEPFWNELAAELKGQKAVVLMQGATFNDFLRSNDDPAPFLGYFHKLPPGTFLVLSADNTTHEPTLREAYVENPALHQFLLVGGAHYIDKHHKLLRMTSSVKKLSLFTPNLTESLAAANTLLTFSYEFDINGAKPAVAIEKDGDPNDQSKYILLTTNAPKFVQLFDPISKPAESKMASLFAHYGHELVQRFPLRWDKFPDADYSFYVTQCRL